MLTSTAVEVEQTPIWLGIDVAKATFEAALGSADAAHPGWRKAPTRRFDRSPEGVKACCAWAASLAPRAPDPAGPVFHVVMEATGRYSLELSAWFSRQAAATAPAIINPRLTKAYAQSLAIHNRTDAVDARILAHYGAERTPVSYAPSGPEREQLRDLTRYRQTLVEAKQAEENRAEEPTASALVRRTQTRRISQLSRDIARIEKQIRTLIEQTPEVKRDFHLLQSIAGVGPVTAMIVLGELGDLRRFRRARQLSAFAGVAPTCHDSGSSVHQKSHLSKSGSAHVRRILYLSALAATRGDNDFADTYHRLLAKGKKPLVALGAIMRKILVVMRAILISGQGYQSHFKKHGAQTCG